MMHLSIRSRYRLVFICGAILFFRFFLPYGRNASSSIEHDITDSINSILRLSARICKTGGDEVQRLTSSLRDGSRSSSSSLGYKGPPAPLSQINKNKPPKNPKPPIKPKGKAPSSGGQHLHLAEPQVTILKADVGWGGHDGPDPPKPPSKPPRGSRPPIADPFPLLSKPQPLSPFYAKLLKERTAPPDRHPPEDTPLFIGFTRNWPQLIQCVVSYIAAGWPASDIYVVENTGVMYSNRDNLLTLQNPFYLNHTQLGMLGVNVLITPTLLTFSQLQNYYAWTALERGWEEFFWSHQDVVVFSNKDFGKTKTEKDEERERKSGGGNNIYDRNSVDSFYFLAVSVLQNLRNNRDGKLEKRWANVFFAYDQLTLVNVASVIGIGGWDTHIPFYTADCDMYIRQTWGGWTHYTAPEVGIILDVASVLDDVGALLRFPGMHASFRGDPGVPLEEQPWWRAVNALFGEEDNSRTHEHLRGEEVSSEEEEEENEVDTYEQSKSTSAQESFLHEMNILTRVSKQVDRHGETFSNLVATVKRMSEVKYAGDTNGHRNTWQSKQSGGQGEPFYRDSEGFEQGVLMNIDLGRAVFAEKWGHRGCDISRMGDMGNEDAWRLERDWGDGEGYEGDGW